MIECVVNVSEGRDPAVLRALADACGPSLLDLHSDGDHHRSVFTLAGPGPTDADPAARALAAAVAERVALAGHEGVHPRQGALDVVPFVALSGTAGERGLASEIAHAFGEWWARTFAVPVFFFGDADAGARDLPRTRRAAFRVREPDVGPPAAHPRLGATMIGVRPPLVALNCVLATPHVEVARRIARRARERDGGLPGVRALGFPLASRQRAQVSLNLVDLDRTGVQDACVAVRELARREGTEVVQVELVGLVPRRELDRCSGDFLRWSGLDVDATIEVRLARQAAAGGVTR